MEMLLYRIKGWICNKLHRIETVDDTIIGYQDGWAVLKYVYGEYLYAPPNNCYNFTVAVRRGFRDWRVGHNVNSYVCNDVDE